MEEAETGKMYYVTKIYGEIIRMYTVITLGNKGATKID